MYIGGETGCKSCAQKVSELRYGLVELPIDNDWLSREQVKELCEPCYNNMVKNNISRIRRSHFLEKFESPKMKFYQINYKGPEGSKLHLAGHTIEAGSVAYFEIDKMPVDEEILQMCPDVTYSIVEMDKKPSALEVKAKAKVLLGQKGIKWVGTSPLRHNEHGKFPRHEVVFVDTDVAQKLVSLGGFELV